MSSRSAESPSSAGRQVVQASRLPKQPGRLHHERDDPSRWLSQSKLEGRMVDDDGDWVEIVRGPLAGSGSWTGYTATPATRPAATIGGSAGR